MPLMSEAMPDVGMTVQIVNARCWDCSGMTYSRTAGGFACANPICGKVVELSPRGAGFWATREWQPAANQPQTR